MSVPRIFVSVASYRDTECQWTVKDLFDKAADPSRVFVGIGWQFVPEEDQDCFLVSTRPEQCRVIESDARDSRGVCWARSQIQTLWNGEEYHLQIDSHMRFIEDWDEVLIAMLADCPSDKPVLSHYPASYQPPDKLGRPIIAIMYPQFFDRNGIISLHSRAQNPEDAPAVPAPNPFIGAGLVFARSDVIAEVPYDPYLYFMGEEITLAARLYTHGWDVFTPNKVVAYHDYTKRPGRRRHWNDHKRWDDINRLSLARVRHLLGMEVSADTEVLKQFDRFGLGSVRSLEQFEAFSAIDFRRRTIDGKDALALEMGKEPADIRRANREKFASIWQDNTWGATETRSGSGSTRAATAGLRVELPRLFDFLGVRILADAGCGDFNWMGEAAAGLRLYLGFDVVEDALTVARNKAGRRLNQSFAIADICVDTLPECDAILCRDVLTHLPLGWVKLALKRFKDSGSRYLIATTNATQANVAIAVGDWHAMDLTAAPLDLPQPRLLLPEGGTKALGVWALADL